MLGQARNSLKNPLGVWWYKANMGLLGADFISAFVHPDNPFPDPDPPVVMPSNEGTDTER